MGSPVQLASFPPEILGEIFLASIPVKGNRDNLPAYFPFTLTHVCRHWRASALAFQKLWSFIDVEQTEENQEGDTGDHELLEEYLARSGDHPLTIHLAHNNDTMHYSTFMATLSDHTRRWGTVVFDRIFEYAFDCLFEGQPEDYPKLRSLDCTFTDFDSDPDTRQTLGSMPWSQLTRYHEYECSWTPESFQWSVIKELVNVVDLRVELSGPSGFSKVEMPRLRLAYVHPDDEGANVTEILDSFEFPSIQGLSLKFLPSHSLDVFLPAQFKHLKVLRLCGRLLISNASFLRILTELEALTDLAVEMRGAYPLESLEPGIDAPYLFELLTPDRVAQPVVLPKLEVLRLTEFNPDGVDALLSMLRRRFAGSDSTQLQFVRLRRFDLWVCPRSWFDEETRPSAIQGGLEALHALKIQEGWDIRVDEEWQGDFWKEEMDL